MLGLRNPTYVGRKEQVLGCELDASGSGQGLATGPCDPRGEPSRLELDQLGDC
jgi:hypothetical protein